MRQTLTETAKPNALRFLTQAAEDLAEIQEAVRSRVANARRCGASWEEIGASLGLSKQTAFNRYGKPKRNTSNDHLYTEAENREADTALAALQGAAARQELQEHHAEAVKFLDGQEPAAKVRTPAGTIELGPEDFGSEYKDDRPSFTLHSAGMIDGVAQPGTGKGPHACPRCGSTNHKSGKPHTFNAYPGECKPTKYDPADIADAITNYLKATK